MIALRVLAVTMDAKRTRTIPPHLFFIIKFPASLNFHTGHQSLLPERKTDFHVKHLLKDLHQARATILPTNVRITSIANLSDGKYKYDEAYCAHSASQEAIQRIK